MILIKSSMKLINSDLVSLITLFFLISIIVGVWYYRGLPQVIPQKKEFIFSRPLPKFSLKFFFKILLSIAGVSLLGYFLFKVLGLNPFLFMNEGDQIKHLQNDVDRNFKTSERNQHAILDRLGYLQEDLDARTDAISKSISNNHLDDQNRARVSILADGRVEEQNLIERTNQAAVFLAQEAQSKAPRDFIERDLSGLTTFEDSSNPALHSEAFHSAISKIAKSKADSQNSRCKVPTLTCDEAFSLKSALENSMRSLEGGSKFEVKVCSLKLSDSAKNVQDPTTDQLEFVKPKEYTDSPFYVKYKLIDDECNISYHCLILTGPKDLLNNYFAILMENLHDNAHIGSPTTLGRDVALRLDRESRAIYHDLRQKAKLARNDLLSHREKLNVLFEHAEGAPLKLQIKQDLALVNLRILFLSWYYHIPPSLESSVIPTKEQIVSQLVEYLHKYSNNPPSDLETQDLGSLFKLALQGDLKTFIKDPKVDSFKEIQEKTVEIFNKQNTVYEMPVKPHSDESITLTFLYTFKFSLKDGKIVQKIVPLRYFYFQRSTNGLVR